MIKVSAPTAVGLASDRHWGLSQADPSSRPKTRTSVSRPDRVKVRTTVAVPATAIANASNRVTWDRAVAETARAKGTVSSKNIEVIVAYWKVPLTRSSPPTRVGPVA